MLFTIGLLLLLTPFPSNQASTSVRTDSTGSSVIKADGTLTLSKPKPAAAPTKQTVPSTLKPNAVNQTLLSTSAISQKPSAVNAAVTKSKPGPAVTQTTPSPAVKATASSGSITNKDKPTASVNVTAETKSLSTSDVKNSKNKSASSRLQNVLSTPAKAVKPAGATEEKITVSASGTTPSKAQSSSSRTIKDKLHHLVNQTISVKPPSGAEVKNSKDKPAPTVAPDVQSTPTKSALAVVVKTIKDKLHSSTNNTISVKSPTGSEERDSKHKPAPTGATAVHVNQTIAKSVSGSEVKANKQNPTSTGRSDGQSSSRKPALVSQASTGSEARPNKGKPAPTRTPDVQSTSAKSSSASGAKTDKDKPQPSTNQTVSGKTPPGSEARPTKEKPASTRTPDVQTTSAKSSSASGAKTDKDKPQPSINQTVSEKTSSGSEARPTKEKPTSAGTPDVQTSSAKSSSTSGPKTDKDKPQPSTNQTVSEKIPPGSEARPTKEKPASAGTPDVQSTSAKSSSASGAKTDKDKPQPSINQTVSEKTSSGSEARPTKEKPTSAGTPDVQSTSAKSSSTSGAKTDKDKPQPLTNQTVSEKTPSGSETKPTKEKPSPTRTPDVQTSSAKSSSTSGPTTDKDKPQPSTNQTVSEKTPHGSAARPNKEKPRSAGTPDVQSTSAKSSSASGAKTDKDKPQPSTNQTVSEKTSSGSEARPTKEKPASAGTPDVQTSSAKSSSTSGPKTDKDKPQPSTNQTVSEKTPPGSAARPTKEKPRSTGTPDIHLTISKSAPAKGPKTTKNNPTASVNQPNVTKSFSPKDESVSETPLSTPGTAVTASASAADKDKLTVSANHTTVNEPPTTTKENSVPSQPIKVVISNGCDSRNAQEQQLELQPGAPLVMTHKISLLPGGCSGECESELAALIRRVVRLEREMSLLKDKCPCSLNCPDDCSGNGKCEKGKCVCHQGFVGPDCSKCAQGADCSKKVVRSTTNETINTAVQVHKNKQSVLEKTTKVEHPPKNGTEISTTAKPGVVKTQDTAGTHSTPSRDHQNDGGRLKEANRGRTEVLLHNDPKKNSGSELKDEPQSNVTQSNDRKHKGSAKPRTVLITSVGTNKTKPGKETQEAGSNRTHSSKQKDNKSDKVSSVDNKNKEDTKKEKILQGSKFVVLQNETHGPKVRSGIGGSGLGSVKVVNASSNSFTLTWLAPQGMFKNFTVIRTEPPLKGDEDDQEALKKEDHDGEKTRSKNSTEVRVQTESTNTGPKPAGPRGKDDTKRISIVVPGSVRSVEFSNLRINTRYALQIYGTSAEKRSRIHRATAVTGPESATDMVFSNVTESSLTVSWSKPKTKFTGFRVTYANTVTGERHFVTVSPQQSHVVLSKLSAGSTYTVSVTTTLGRAQSDALTSGITTVPAPPTHLQVANVTDNRAALRWTPSLGKVDRFIITYESSKTANVTVTVMLPENSVEHQLRGLQRGTVYTVRVLSQKGNVQSTALSTTFTTANVVKASEVGPRSAVIMWKTPTVVYQSYRLTYQVAGEAKEEVILDPTVTEYKLTGLLPMSRYLVLVQGERDGQSTSLVTTEFITGKLRFPFPTECSQELLNGALQSGEVDIYPQGKEGRPVRVYCDMETDGGGWTVFQRRINGRTDFYRNWSDYRAGFGNLSEEFWLGNELLHNLTSVGPVSLRVDMRSGNDTAYAHYTNFSVNSEKKHYALTVFGFRGTAGDSMKYHNGRPFSTWDKNPHSLGIHCAKAYTGGWWYKNCYKTNLNGRYGTNSDNQGIVWIDWKGKDFSIPFTEMKFRPSTFHPVTHG